MTSPTRHDKLCHFRAETSVAVRGWEVGKERVCTMVGEGLFLVWDVGPDYSCVMSGLAQPLKRRKKRFSSTVSSRLRSMEVTMGK